MVSTVITFSKSDVQPPVFVAGSFTKWSPVEMSVKKTETAGAIRNQFSYEAELQPGEYQYKFRLGPGDWWVLDDTSPSANDDSGNVNNILTVRPEEPKASESEISEDTAQSLNVSNTEKTAAIPRVLPKDQELLVEVDGKPPTNAQANIGQKVIKTDGLKVEAPEEDAQKVNSQFDGDKEDLIPDIAPPPYSVITGNGAELTSRSPKSESTDLEDADGRNNARSIGIKRSAESRPSSASNPPPKSRFSGRNVAWVVAVVAIPLGLAFLWYR